jgi:hypothetical protein
VSGVGGPAFVKATAGPPSLAVKENASGGGGPREDQKMGAEATCKVTFKGRSSAGKARLETDVLQFRGGDVKLAIPFKTIEKVGSCKGQLSVTFGGQTAIFDLGAASTKWADKIKNPPSRLQKIGVKPEWRASALGVDDEQFLAELENVVAHLSIGRVARKSDAIFYGVTNDVQLARLQTLKTSLVPNGALWIIRPKGRPEISERAVMDAGKAAGLVDVKVVSFSATHTAEKFVIPVAARPSR